MILHIKSHMTSFEHSVPATYEGIKSLFDMFPFVEQIVAHHQTLKGAIDEVVEYLSSHHMDAWLSAESPLRKSDEATIRALGYNDSSDDYYDDIQDAVDHHNLISNRLGQRYGNVGEYHDIKVKHPHDIIPQLKEQPQGFGWLRQYPEHEWESKMKEVYPKRDFKHTLDKKKKGELSPAIMINNTLSDGYGRVHLAHALGEGVPVMYHKRKKLAKSTALQKSEDMSRVSSVVVSTENKVLMLQRRDNKKWTFPGGHLNDTETHLQGAVRELWEEAGIRANPDEMILLGNKKTFQKKDIYVYLYVVSSEVATTASNDPDKEAQKFEWIPHIIPKEIEDNLYIPVGDNASLSMFSKWLLRKKVDNLKSKLKKD